MAILDFIKKRKEKERFDKKSKGKQSTGDGLNENKEKKPKALKKAIFTDSKDGKKSVFVGAHITEKATFLNKENAYVFKIKPLANKIMVKQAVKEAYKVEPRKINIINISTREKIVRGRRGTEPGFKKAIVYLKKGDKIDIS